VKSYMDKVKRLELELDATEAPAAHPACAPELRVDQDAARRMIMAALSLPTTSAQSEASGIKRKADDG
jgi:hypothetical protein